MKRDKLARNTSSLGYPLFETEQGQDPNRTLADVSKSKDVRLWEGFPVMLANCAQEGHFNLKLCLGYLKDSAKRSLFLSLVALSLSLYEYLDLNFTWHKSLLKLLTSKKKKEKTNFLKHFKKGDSFYLAGRELSAERLKTAFKNYFSPEHNRLKELLAVREEFNLEFALSQVFSAKQKELFLKKLKGEKLSKTESEYFSRTVKKKVLALANPELYRLAQELLR